MWRLKKVVNSLTLCCSVRQHSHPWLPLPEKGAWVAASKKDLSTCAKALLQKRENERSNVHGSASTSTTVLLHLASFHFMCSVSLFFRFSTVCFAPACFFSFHLPVVMLSFVPFFTSFKCVRLYLFVSLSSSVSTSVCIVHFLFLVVFSVLLLFLFSSLFTTWSPVMFQPQEGKHEACIELHHHSEST